MRREKILAAHGSKTVERFGTARNTEKLPLQQDTNYWQLVTQEYPECCI